MFATDELRRDHEVILATLTRLETQAEWMEAGKNVSEESLARVLDFLRIYADRCHHGKEEEVLFPALSNAGMSVVGGPIGVMLAEHDEGRSAIRAMAEALPRFEEPAGRLDFAAAAQHYCHLLRAHIEKENNILFMMAERILPPEEQARIKEAFDRIEKERLAPGQRERFEALSPV